MVSLKINVCVTCFWLLFVIGWGTEVLAQGQPQRPKRKAELVEDDGEKKVDSLVAKEQFEPKPGERFDLIFNFSFPIVPAAPSDQVPVSFNPFQSNTISLMFSYNFVLNRRITLRTFPGFTWYKLSFQQGDASKLFPSTATDITKLSTVTSETLRAFYLEFPLALSWVIERDEREKPLIYWDIGGSFGFIAPLIGTTEYERIRGTDSQSITETFKPIPNFQTWRFTALTRIVYKFVGLHVQYRLNELFYTDKGYSSNNITEPGTNSYPTLPKLEVGITIVL